MADGTDYLSFQTYSSEAAAEPLLEALEARGILYKTVVDKGQLVVDPTFANNRFVTTFIVKLRPADFEAAAQVQELVSQAALADIAPDHYLFAFSDEELRELLARPDEWSSLDVTLAGQLLRQRGHEVSGVALAQLRQRRVAQLAQPEPSHPFWVVLGYLSALLGGVFGLLIGYHLHYHRKALPDGRRVYAFSSGDRGHGFVILVLAVVVLVAGLATRVLLPHYFRY